MKKRAVTPLFLMVCCFLAEPIEAFAEDSSIKLSACGHHDYPPWNWTSGSEIKGACAEVTKTLFANLGVDVDLTYVGPWKRCQSYIETGRVDINICSFINETRKSYSTFIATPMGFNEQAVFVNKSASFAFQNWQDLAGKKAGMVLGVSIGQRFDRYLKDNTNIERVTTYRQNFHKLFHQRVDFIPVGRFSGLAMLQAFGIKDDIVDLPTSIFTGNLYISMSKKSPYLYLLPEIEKQMQSDDYPVWVKSLLIKYAGVYAKEAQLKPIE
ncbi:substrate-binding periplasmic protein [Agarivorans sp. QJM3NY_25]|uniref:substrate-binding periplasmic protein n=1 Tax=Agarivorans sp. QJM3NY_25 TaxID=3421430 RepID=UPI003D7DA3CD